jgi:hypothetical protein
MSVIMTQAPRAFRLNIVGDLSVIAPEWPVVRGRLTAEPYR